MAKGVIFTSQARADIRAIDQPVALQILKTLARFLQSGEGKLDCTEKPSTFSYAIVRLAYESSTGRR